MKTSTAQTNDPSVLLIDRDGIIVDAREGTCSALGWERGELVNKRMSELLEFGSDVLMERLHEMQDDSVPGFSFLTLVRRHHQSCVPTTAQVRRMPDLDCFTVAFDELNNHTADGTLPQVNEEIKTAKSRDLDASCSKPTNETQIAPTNEKSIDIEEAPANTNGAGPKFRNIFLNDPQRPASNSAPSSPVTRIDETISQLESEDHERRRLEERVLSLTEQLQQLHGQLKSNLESENVCQKKLRERETELRNTEQSKVAAEVALCEQRNERARLEEELSQLKSNHAKLEAERISSQKEWLAKLDIAFTELQESDARLANEIETRRGIQETLRTIQQEFSTFSKAI
jgi:hypothetical protein